MCFTSSKNGEEMLEVYGGATPVWAVAGVISGISWVETYIH